MAMDPGFRDHVADLLAPMGPVAIKPMFGGGGVYLWNSEAAARAWYTPEWEKRMEAAFGARPTVTYYDNHVVVDNEAGAVRVEES